MVVSVAAPLRATAAHQRSWVPLRESPTAYEVSRAASRALVRRQLAHPSSLEGASTEMPTINSETLTAFVSDEVYAANDEGASQAEAGATQESQNF